MKKIMMTMVAGVAAAGIALSGCTPGNNVPGATAAGAVAGGLAGGLIFGGSAAGIIGGALLGGIVGNVIGNQMDYNDRVRMGQVYYAPVGETVVWTNTDTGVVYRVTPTRVYYHHGYSCREYTTRVNINGQWRIAHGHVCRTPDGVWVEN